MKYTQNQAGPKGYKTFCMLSSAVQEKSLNAWYLIFYKQISFTAGLNMKKVL